MSNVDYEGRIFHGMGLSTDVIESSALALIDACNSIERARVIEKETRKEDRLNLRTNYQQRKNTYA